MEKATVNSEETQAANDLQNIVEDVAHKKAKNTLFTLKLINQLSSFRIRKKH